MSPILLLLLLAAPKVAVDTSGVILVRGEEGWGQVCAIDATHAWTAKHVTAERTIFGADSLRPMIFATNEDTQGTVIQIYSDRRRDLAVVEAVVGTFKRFYKLSTEAPQVGDKVTLVGIDEDFLPLIVTARVRSNIAGSLIYDRTPGPGSSGSCVLNRKGELVAINTAGRQTRDGSAWSRGMAWSLYGTWSEIPVRFKVEPEKEAAPAAVEKKVEEESSTESSTLAPSSPQ